ncbi:glycosyltransferase family 4 protein [candidate division WOR-3 bacterium]|nr:glycosyltransferase family 4 protein [candidate division WOR-3 bacterium]
MRIGIDASTIGTPGGPRVYVINLIKSLLKTDKKNEYVIFYNSKKWIGMFPEAKEIAVPFSSPLFRLFREHFLLPIFYKREKLNLIHNTKSAISILKPCKRIVTLFDLIPITYPETESLLARVYWKVQIPIAAKFSDLIITASEYSKKQIIRKFNVQDIKIKVIPLGVSEDFTSNYQLPITNYQLPTKYILYVGAIKPRKNLNTLIKAYASIKDKLEYKLVIVGKSGWGSKNLFKFIKSLGLRSEKLEVGNQKSEIRGQRTSDIIFTGFVPDKDLPYIYSNADLFIYLSRYEGFGLPILEAMASGVSVICSNASSLIEIAQDAAILVNPENVNEVSKSIYKVLTNNSLRGNLIRNGLKRAGNFPWQNTALKTLKVYNSL